MEARSILVGLAIGVCAFALAWATVRHFTGLAAEHSLALAIAIAIGDRRRPQHPRPLRQVEDRLAPLLADFLYKMLIAAPHERPRIMPAATSEGKWAPMPTLVMPTMAAVARSAVPARLL